MRFEPVSTDPRQQPPGVASTVPPLAPSNGRHQQAGPMPQTPPTATAQPEAAPRPRMDFQVVRELRRELTERLTLWQRGREFTVDEEDTERARLAVGVVAAYA